MQQRIHFKRFAQPQVKRNIAMARHPFEVVIVINPHRMIAALGLKGDHGMTALGGLEVKLPIDQQRVVFNRPPHSIERLDQRFRQSCQLGLIGGAIKANILLAQRIL